MDADERLTVLKKAYADIILNTAKEAAARIMVSERKALRFQHELFASKEEALQMLLRLKQMMDSKISEAEMTSFSQQRKIEELEAQLQEAEDIVKDLREELREVQAELERAPNKEVKHLEHDNIAALETSEDNRLNVSQSIKFPPPELLHESVPASDTTSTILNQRNEGQQFYNSLVHMKNSYVGSPDLPSIILRSKEPELYRNGCTQRVRACERTPLVRELSFSEKINDLKHDSTVKEDDEGERIYKAPACEADKMCNIEKNEAVQVDNRVSSWYQVRVVKSFLRKRKRATRYRKKRTSSCLYQPDQFKKTNQAADISCLTNPNSIKDSVQSADDPLKMAPRVSSDANEIGIDQEYAETTKTDADLVRVCGVQSTTNRGDAFGDNLVPTRQEKSEHPESSVVSVCHMNLEKVDVQLVNSETKASDTTSGIPIPPVNDRIIKYTFQRKRKRETLSSSDGNASTENSTLKRKEGENENGSLEPEKSSLIAESSRDSRRLAQVARQLISLSEKKWWQ